MRYSTGQIKFIKQGAGVVRNRSSVSKPPRSRPLSLRTLDSLLRFNVQFVVHSAFQLGDQPFDRIICQARSQQI